MVAKIFRSSLLCVLIAYIVIPILVPLIFSFSVAWTDVLPQGFTVSWYKRIFSIPRYYQGLKTSLFIAFLTVIVNIFICVPGAYAINRLRGKIGDIMRTGSKILPLVFPPIAVGTAFVQAFNKPPLMWSGTIFLVIMAHAALGLPFMFRNVLAAFQTIDERTLSEAAASLGANVWQRLLYVIFPNIIPGVLSGALLVFAVSMGQFEVTAMIAGFGWTTLPLLLYRSLIDDLRVASAISGILITTSLVAFLGMTIISYMLGRGKYLGGTK
ncbi:MAG: ABC transporter permease [Candidatus Bathyarchaeia archaeon]